MMLQMMTANRLIDGVVVFLGDDGWTEDVAQGQIIYSPQEAELMMMIAVGCVERQNVIDPELIDVLKDAGDVRLVKQREAIRAVVGAGAAAFCGQAAAS